MGTRSDIIAKGSDGKWRRIYCHWDGYLEHNGKILFESYKTQAKIDKLMALGDLSSLGPNIGKKIDFDYDMKAYTAMSKGLMTEAEHQALRAKMQRQCKAYGRDRGEKDNEAAVFENKADAWPESDTWTEFTYVWDGERWFVGDPDEGTQTLVDLGEALSGKKIVTPSVKWFGVAGGRHKPVAATAE